MRAMILQSAAGRLDDLRAVMREPSYARYAVGHFAATTAFWMQRIAVGWVTWELTGSAFWLGAVAFAELFPSLLSTFVGGALADRRGRARVMYAAQWGQAVLSGILFGLTAMGLLTVTALVLCMAALGLLAGLMLPSRLSMPHLLVRPALLPSALAVNSTTFNLSRLVGPALAAPVLLGAGASAVFAAALIGNLIFVALLASIAAGTERPQTATNPVSYATVLKGLAQSPLVLAVIALQFAQGMLVRPASELFPAFADTVFGAGELGLSVLNAALGAGAILGALALSRSRGEHEALTMIMRVSLIHALSLAAFAFTGTLWAACLVLILHGGTMTASNIAALTYVQQKTDPARMGRILSVYGIVFRVAPALGALSFGGVAEALGLGRATLLFALLGTGATAALWLWVRIEEARAARTAPSS